MKFTKMHGTGNDYIYVNCFEERVEAPEKLAIRLSEPHFSIGADGLILIGPSEVADVSMRMYNADGSEGAMCGNGIRCVGKYAYDFGLVDKEELTVETKSGIKRLTLFVEDGKVARVRVMMGKPELDAAKVPALVVTEQALDVPITIGGEYFKFTAVSMGNPHAVVFVEKAMDFPVEQFGPLFETSPLFPDRINTEFVEVADAHTLKMRVWERGSGETLACGTGACAAAVAAILTERIEEGEVTVKLLGGPLAIEWDRATDEVYMTGPAVTAFTGEVELG